MLQLMKREWLKNWPIVLALFFLVIFLHVLNISTSFSYIYTFIMFIVFTRNRDQEHQFLISLPIKKNHIVASRYVFIVILCSCFLVYQLFLGEVIFKEHIPLSQFVMLIFFCLMMMAVAVSLPLYYYFKSLWIAFTLQLLLIFLGPLLFLMIVNSPFQWLDAIIEQILDIVFIEPYSISILFSIMILFLSYLLSCRIFARRDFS